MRYETLRQGLVGAWCPSLGPSGNTLLDRSGYGNHGTLTNMDAGTDWVGSRYGWALDFDNTDDAVNVGVSGGNLTEAIPFSVSAWGFARSAAGNRGLISRDQSGPFAFSIRFDGGSTLNVLCDSATLAGPTITLNQWFHYCVTFAPSLRNIYLNGSLAVISTATYTITANNDVLYIGTDFNPGVSRTWDGLIDDVRLFNRSLTEPEIRLLATEPGIGLKPEPTSVFFGAQLFNAAWARNSNVILSPVGAA